MHKVGYWLMTIGLLSLVSAVTVLSGDGHNGAILLGVGCIVVAALLIEAA